MASGQRSTNYHAVRETTVCFSLRNVTLYTNTRTTAAPEDVEDKRRDTGVAAAAAERAATAAALCRRWSTRPPAAITAFSAGLVRDAVAAAATLCRELNGAAGQPLSGGDLSWPYCHEHRTFIIGQSARCA